ncbi:MAG: metallophosphatase family protein [Acidobacteriia bacterium]|nr:metallophosphatase family protein [Terriglobia bacterium]
MTRFAVLADIHANAWALEAVLEDVHRRGLETILNLGDVLYGPLQPRPTYDLLMREKAARTVQGNQDREIYAAAEPDLAANPTLAYTVKDLGPEPIAWLRQLPRTAELDSGVFLCHGTPASDTTYLLEDVSSGRPLVRAEQDVLRDLGGVTHPVVLCGHTHIPRLVRLANGQMIANPGSVGLPAYADDAPVRHRMETYSPHASYAILRQGEAGWYVSFVRVPYDHESAAKQAAALGRHDWAHALLTGRMAG